MKKMKKVLAFCLTVILAICSFEIAFFSSAYDSITNEQIINKIEALQSIFDGYCWNGNKTENQLIDALNENNLSFGLTSSCCPCSSASTHYRESGCTSNIFEGSAQCFGFAKYFSFVLFGCKAKVQNGWTEYTDSAAKSVKLEPGDYIATSSHAYVVWYVDEANDRLHVVHCNWWDNQRKFCEIHYGDPYSDYGGQYNPGKLSSIRANLIRVLKHPTTTEKADLNKYTTIHVHSYSKYYEAAHPHRYYMRCSCGDYYYTGENAAVMNNYYEAAHPHREYKKCSLCDYYEYTGGTHYVSTCDYCAHNFKLTVNYYSNYADKSFADALNPVSRNDNVLVRSYDFYYTSSYPYGLHDYVSEDAGTYLGRSGYTATGYWNTKPDGSGLWVHQGTSFSSGQELAQALGKDISNGDASINLYPEWFPNDYRLYFNVMGGTCPELDVIQRHVYYGNTYGELPTPTRTGYTFLGWYTSASGGSLITENSTVTIMEDHTLYAHWSPYIYLVRFNGNGATDGNMDDQIFTYDVAQNLTANTFTRTHTVTYEYNDPAGNNTEISATTTSTFNGWSKSAIGEVVYTDGQNVTNLAGSGMITLYANWTLGTVILPTPNDRTGYTFKGWYHNSALTTFAGEAGASFKPTDDMTLYAKWVGNTYFVRFNGNGATGGNMSSQRFTYGLEQNLSANNFLREYTVTFDYDGATGGETEPTATAAATFNGWSTSAYGAKVYDDMQSVKDLTTDDTITLYARWTLGRITLPTPTRTGYTFKGWYRKSTESASTPTVFVGAGGASYTPTKDITLYAKWGEGAYTVTFDGNGATSGSMEDQPFEHDVAQNLTANAFVRAYTVTYEYNGATGGNGVTSAVADATFNGWSTSADGEVVYTDGQNVVNLAGIGSVTLYANWTLGTIKLPSPTRTGYSFNGWYTKSDLTNYAGGNNAPYKPTENITLYARWVASHYSVTFDGNGATGGSMENQTFTYDVEQDLSANQYVREYTVTFDYDGATGGETEPTATASAAFNGWATSAYGAKVYDDMQSVKNLATNFGTVTLYAKWTSGRITLPTPTRTGYTFKGWYRKSTESASTPTVFVGAGGASYTLTKDITLYAKWGDGAYTVQFNGNGATGGSMEDQPFEHDTAQDLTANAFMRTYTVTYEYNGATDGNTEATAIAAAAFNGWSTSATGEVVYTDGENVVNLAGSGTVTLYANWTLGSIKLPEPSRNGYSFNAWYTDPDLTSFAGWSKSNYTPTSDSTLYAKWVARRYTVVFNGNGATGGSMENQTFTYDVEQSLSPNAFTRSHTVTFEYNGATGGNDVTTATAVATFDGWATSPRDAKVYDDMQSVKNLASSGTVKLYANWTVDTVMLPTPVRTGYTFDGWYYNAALTAPVGVGITYFSPNSNRTLYAKWTQNEPAAAEIVAKADSTAVIDREHGFIYGLDFGTSAGALRTERFDVAEGYHFETSSNGTICTGMILRVVNDETNETVESFTVVIFGDLNGDGLLTTTDVSIARNVNAGLTEFAADSPFRFASDVTHDGIVNTTDIAKIRSAQVGLEDLVQTA